MFSYIRNLIWKRNFIKMTDIIKKHHKDAIKYNPHTRIFTFTWSEEFETKLKSKKWYKL